MKFTIAFLLISFSILSCNSEYKIVKYSDYYFEKGKEKQFNLKIRLPKGYQFLGLSGGGETKEYQFWYTDSSVFYITNDLGTPFLNYTNIQENDDSYRKRFDAFIEGDTITLWGINKDTLCWKDIKEKHFSYGYSRVPSSKKEMFEKIIKELNSQVQKNKYY